MKKYVILTIAAVVFIFGGTTVFAQDKFGETDEQRKECVNQLSFYEEHFNQKDYEGALPSWRKAFEVCPRAARQKLYVHGAVLFRQLISKTRDESSKAALLDTLFMLHDLRAENFPESAVLSINNKGQDALMYIKNDNRRVYDELMKVVERNGVEILPGLLVGLMDSAVGLYGEGVLSGEEVFERYQGIMDLLEQIQITKNDSNVAEVAEGIQKKFIQSDVADCERIVELSATQLAASPDSYEVAGNVARRLSNAGCSDNELYVAALYQMNRIQPESRTAYFLYKIHNARGETGAAIELMLQAIDLEEENDQKADYYFELAQTLVTAGSNIKGYEYAIKAAQLDVDGSVEGKAYMLCGTVWSATECKGNEIEKRAKYWVVVDFYERAKRVDPSLTDSCNRSIAQYSKYFPATDDAFMYDIEDGQSYTVSCDGLTATTTVRTQK